MVQCSLRSQHCLPSSTTSMCFNVVNVVQLRLHGSTYLCGSSTFTWFHGPIINTNLVYSVQLRPLGSIHSQCGSTTSTQLNVSTRFNYVYMVQLHLRGSATSHYLLNLVSVLTAHPGVERIRTGQRNILSRLFYIYFIMIYISIYKFGLFVCLFVSNKRQNG